MIHDLSPQEEEAIKALAIRAQSSRAAEAELIQRYSNRAALAKQLWVGFVSVGTAIVFTTIFIFKMQASIDRVAAENVQLLAQINQLRQDGQAERQQIRTDLSQAFREIHQLNLEMKDKAPRP